VVPRQVKQHLQQNEHPAKNIHKLKSRLGRASTHMSVQRRERCRCEPVAGMVAGVLLTKSDNANACKSRCRVAHRHNRCCRP
jgi:hypothetical protein